MNQQQIQSAHIPSLLIALSVSAGLALLAIDINSDLPAASAVMAENISEEACPQQPEGLSSQRTQPQQERQRNLRRPQGPSGMLVIMPAVYVELLIPADETSSPAVVI